MSGMEEMLGQRDSRELPELQIVPLERQQEITHMPPGVAQEIISHIENEEDEDEQRRKDIKKIKHPLN